MADMPHAALCRAGGRKRKSLSEIQPRVRRKVCQNAAATTLLCEQTDLRQELSTRYVQHESRRM